MNAEIIPDMPEAEYHARPELSASIAKRLVEPGGPARWKHERDHGRVETKALSLGHAAHRLVLGVGAPIAIIPDECLSKNGAASTTEAKLFIADARTQGAIPLKRAEADVMADMAEALYQHRLARQLLSTHGTQVELSGFATDPDSGVDLRCRFDAASPAGVVDYKTAVTADPAAWARQAAKLGVHLQAAHYRWMAQQLGLTDGPLWFVVQEKTPPYSPAVIRLSDSAEQLGAQRMREAIQIWAEAHATGVWPGYGDGEHIVDLPTYAYDDDLDSEIQI